MSCCAPILPTPGTASSCATWWQTGRAARSIRPARLLDLGAERVDAAGHRIWDVETGAALAVLRGHADMVKAAAWSLDGRRLATASHDRTAQVWDIERRVELAIFSGHQDRVRDVAWSSDSRYLATASEDRTARVWEAASGTEMAVLYGHEDAVESVAWSPDGERIATASHDRTARVWEAATDLNALVSKARQRVLRELTDEERRSAMLSR